MLYTFNITSSSKLYRNVFRFTLITRDKLYVYKLYTFVCFIQVAFLDSTVSKLSRRGEIKKDQRINRTSIGMY